ncbi:MAG: thiamine diphosphokinase [Erysipelotrichales bacterium]|nr:MAG: thiamine diphosphokinase [Erysipelotrichales bacterium]
MVKKAVLVCGWQDGLPPDLQGDYIGVDRGAFLLARVGIQMRLAIGDFDSVDEDGKKLIATCAREIIELNPIKNISDAEAALDAALQRGYDDIVLWGALGGRFDHTLVNLKLAQRHSCLRLLTPQNEVFTLGVGEHTLFAEDKPYLSVFSSGDSEISLIGFKYPLDHAFFTSDTTLGLSNQLIEKKAQIIVHQGKILVVRARDK